MPGEFSSYETHRKSGPDLRKSCTSCTGSLIEKKERALARERMISGKPCGNLPQGQRKTRKKVGAVLGVSGKTYEKAKAVVEAAVRRTAHGISYRVDRPKCLGNAVVPAQAILAVRDLLKLINQARRKQ